MADETFADADEKSPRQTLRAGQSLLDCLLLMRKICMAILQEITRRPILSWTFYSVLLTHARMHSVKLSLFLADCSLSLADYSLCWVHCALCLVICMVFDIAISLLIIIFLMTGTKAVHCYEPVDVIYISRLKREQFEFWERIIDEVSVVKKL